MPSKTEDLQDDIPNNINPYKVLEIEKSATPDQIKTAYRKLALKHHPGMLLFTTINSPFTNTQNRQSLGRPEGRS
jgi:preprotein translocase subunit Sec63